MKILKTSRQKGQNMERYKVLSEPKCSHRNNKNKKPKKPTIMIMSKIATLYFQSKIVPIIREIVAL